MAAALGLAACTKAPDNAAPKAAAPAPTGNFDFAGWDQYLGGVDSSQYSSLSQIDKSNVGRLDVVWSYPTARTTSSIR